MRRPSPAASRPLAALLAALAGAPGGPAAAHEEPAPLHRVSFQVERSREVANDWMQAVVGITDEDADAAALADRVNRTMQWALETARRESRVKVESGGYHTFPVQEQGRLRRWRARQELVLEGADQRALGELLGRLQERLQLLSLGFTPSPESRRRAEDELIAEALAAFKARARLVQEQLGASSHQIVHLSLDTGGGVELRPQLVRGMAMESAAAAVAEPALEGGTTRIEVRASATIELD
jgi:predicted secreted protein